MRALPPGIRGAAVLSILTVLLSGCSVAVAGRGLPAAAPGAADAAMAPVPTERVSRITVEALETFWAAEFSAAFGTAWEPVASYTAVDPDDADDPLPPCVQSVSEVEDQAFYCPAADAIVWDAEGLVPDLGARFGPVGIVVVLAHEMGHAVQSRLGLDAAQAADPQRFPTILLEAQADCYAGVAVRHFVEGGVTRLPVSAAERDAALLALVGFRDPLGVAPTDEGAHGNAFDRVSAFQDGYRDGSVRCAEMTLANRAFTQRLFGSAADRARGGNLPLEDLLPAIEADAVAAFTELAAAAGSTWQAPPLSVGRGTACGTGAIAAQGPAAFCPGDGAVSIDTRELGVLHDRFGDYAGATLVASRYGLALLDALGAPTAGPAAGRAATCLAGAYTGRLIDPAGDFGLSPGDLDESVQVLLADDWAARDADGTPPTGDFGFERVQQFISGTLDGPTACGAGG